MRPGDDGPWSGTTRGDRAFALAAAADLDAHTVGRAERDGEIDKLKLETAKKIADALGVGVDDLYERGGGEGETL